MVEYGINFYQIIEIIIKVEPTCCSHEYMFLPFYTQPSQLFLNHKEKIYNSMRQINFFLKCPKKGETNYPQIRK